MRWRSGLGLAPGFAACRGLGLSLLGSSRGNGWHGRNKDTRDACSFSFFNFRSSSPIFCFPFWLWVRLDNSRSTQIVLRLLANQVLSTARLSFSIRFLNSSSKSYCLWVIGLRILGCMTVEHRMPSLLIILYFSVSFVILTFGESTVR